MNQPDLPPKSDLELRTIQSEEILQGAHQVIIEHGAVTYRLVHTKNGKLILQK